jgi:hypothetical protein
LPYAVAALCACAGVNVSQVLLPAHATVQASLHECLLATMPNTHTAPTPAHMHPRHADACNTRAFAGQASNAGLKTTSCEAVQRLKCTNRRRRCFTNSVPSKQSGPRRAGDPRNGADLESSTWLHFPPLFTWPCILAHAVPLRATEAVWAAKRTCGASALYSTHSRCASPNHPARLLVRTTNGARKGGIPVNTRGPAMRARGARHAKSNRQAQGVHYIRAPTSTRAPAAAHKSAPARTLA